MVCYVNVSSMRHIYGTLSDNTGQSIFLKLIPEIKVTEAAKMYINSLCDPKMCPQTKFWISMSYNIEVMLVTIFFLNLMAGVKVRDAP